MRNTKLIIQRKKYWQSGFSRYYKVGTLLLNDYSIFRTEAQFCLHLFRNYGAGRFMALAFREGRRGFFCFWLGEINKGGFIREKKDNSWIRAKAIEQGVENELQLEQIHRSKSRRKRGPDGLTPSSPPGNFYNFEEYDPVLIKQQKGETNSW